MIKIGSMLPKAACLVLFLLLFAWGLQNLGEAELFCRDWSLRYDEGFDEAQKQQAKRHFIDGAEDNKGLWLTFWSEGKGKFEAEFADAEAACIYFDGDASRVKPERFLSGSYPGGLDERGVAVSAELSWRLWGSLDTLGKELRIGGKTKTVCGVYEGETASALLCGDRDTVWRNAEVSAKESLTREELIQFLTGSSLGEPDALVDGGGIWGLLRLLQYLPVFAACAVMAVRLLRMRCGGYGKIVKRGAVLAALFGFALLLPGLLLQLPPWLLPSKWSDLAFWSGLAETLWGYMRDWFALKPAGRDVLVKQCMLLQGLYTAGMLFCLIGVFRSARKEKEIPAPHGKPLHTAGKEAKEGKGDFIALRG